MFKVSIFISVEDAKYHCVNLLKWCYFISATAKHRNPRAAKDAKFISTRELKTKSDKHLNIQVVMKLFDNRQYLILLTFGMCREADCMSI